MWSYQCQISQQRSYSEQFCNYAEMKMSELIYSSKEMCRISSQLKKLTRLKYLILETPYTFFSILSWYFIVLRTLNFLSPMFSGINNNNFSFFGFSKLSFLDPHPRPEGSCKTGYVRPSVRPSVYPSVLPSN